MSTHVLALQSDKIVAWGTNLYGQLGSYAALAYQTPSDVYMKSMKGKTIVQVAAGYVEFRFSFLPKRFSHTCEGTNSALHLLAMELFTVGDLTAMVNWELVNLVLLRKKHIQL